MSQAYTKALEAVAHAQRAIDMMNDVARLIRMGYRANVKRKRKIKRKKRTVQAAHHNASH